MPSGIYPIEKRKGMLGKHHSEKTKIKIGLKSRGRKMPPRSLEYREKLSRNNGMRGKHSKTEFKKGHISYAKRKLIHKINEGKIWRGRIEYKLWRKSVFERDNFTCQKYGIRGGILHPHHINNFAEKEELRFAIDNGITLSEKAHKEFHKKYGYRNNTREQLEEFLAGVLQKDD